MEAKLLVTSGNTNKRWVDLRLPTVLGRGRDAGLTVPHPLISRRHCELFEHDGLLMVRDLQSLNGTMIGGRRIMLAPLPPGATFTVGPLTFQAQYEYEGDLAALPAVQFVDEPHPGAEQPLEALAADDQMPAFFMVEEPTISAGATDADRQVPVQAAPRHPADSGGPDSFFESLEGMEVSPAQLRPKPLPQPVAQAAKRKAAADKNPPAPAKPAPATKSSPWREPVPEALPADAATLADVVPVAEAVAPAAASSEAELVPVVVVPETPGRAEAAKASEPAAAAQPKPDHADDEEEIGDFLSGLQ